MTRVKLIILLVVTVFLSSFLSIELYKLYIKNEPIHALTDELLSEIVVTGLNVAENKVLLEFQMPRNEIIRHVKVEPMVSTEYIKEINTNISNDGEKTIITTQLVPLEISSYRLLDIIRQEIKWFSLVLNEGEREIVYNLENVERQTQ